MDPCPGDLHLCRASKLLGLVTLLSACSSPPKCSGTQGSGMKDSGANTHLNGIRGGSVFFHVTNESGADLENKLEKVYWNFGPESDYITLFELQNQAVVPACISSLDRYKMRVCVTSLTTLMIKNLSTQDSGLYRADFKLKGGRGKQQVFYLTVYEPVPPAQILPKSVFVTPDWCNMTLECRAPRAPEEKLNVTWGSQGVSRELEQRGTPGPAPNPWTLAVRLSAIPPNASLTCVVSNPVDQKNATSALGDICGQVREMDSHGWHVASLKGYIPGVILALLLILGAGLYLWMIHKKKKKKKEKEKEEEKEEEKQEEEMIEMGTGWQEDHRADDDGVHYADVMKVVSPEDKHQRTNDQFQKERESLTVSYCEIQPHPRQ